MNIDMVIYHAFCADGFCAAYLCWKGWPNAKFVPASYGDVSPDVTGLDVWIVDFSYPRDVLLEMKAKAKSLRVFDHHKTAQAALEGLDFCTFDMEKSGARLVLEALPFAVDMHSELIVDYTEDRDLWRWRLPESREFSAGLASYPMDFEVWSGLLARDLKTEGRTILRYQKQLVERAMAGAHEIVIDGLAVPAVNSPFLQSEIGEQLAKRGPFGVVYYINENGDTKYSLRSTDSGPDVSALAKQRGGGGHRNAAGFTIMGELL